MELVSEDIAFAVKAHDGIGTENDRTAVTARKNLARLGKCVFAYKLAGVFAPCELLRVRGDNRV